MQWGAEIPVAGKRPAWLRDDDHVMDIDPGKSTHGEIRPAYRWPWNRIETMRLPADHWAYRAIDRGLTPWAGGDAAPEDWDGGYVLFDHGGVGRGYSADSEGWRDGIIGYRKREAPLPAALLEINKISPQHNSIADTVLENRRLVARVEELLRANNDLVEENRRLKRGRGTATTDHLIITITGPQGCGKTRMAEVLRGVMGRVGALNYDVPVTGGYGSVLESIAKGKPVTIIDGDTVDAVNEAARPPYSVGDTVTLLPAEDGEILPGGTYTIASIGDGGTTMRMDGHPKVVIHAHRIAPRVAIHPAYFHLGAEADRD